MQALSFWAAGNPDERLPILEEWLLSVWAEEKPPVVVSPSVVIDTVRHDLNTSCVSHRDTRLRCSEPDQKSYVLQCKAQSSLDKRCAPEVAFCRRLQCDSA